MNWRYAIGRRLRAVFRRASAERELDEELSLHYDLAVAEQISRGMSVSRARAQVLREFHGADGAREEIRDARGVAWLEHLGRDTRYALRSLAANPAFTVIVVVTLALGIGANSAIFSVVNGVLLRALPYHDPDNLVMVWETDRNSGTEREGASIPDYFDFRARSRSFERLAAFRIAPMNRTGSQAPERVMSARVTGEFLATMGVAPMLGRDFAPAEAAPGGPPAVLVSERFWRSRLGGDPAAVGRPVRLDDSLFTVVGVLPSSFRFPADDVELWAVDQMSPASGPRFRHHITVVGRLAAGVSPVAAQREMAEIATALEEEFAQTNEGRGVHIEPLERALLGEVRPALLILLAAVAVVLVMSCVNAATLLLARRAARVREMAVRTALGAGRARLAQQLLVESTLLALAAAVLGTVLAYAGVPALVAVAPDELPRAADIAVDGRVLAVTLGISVMVALVFGLLPAGGGRRVAPADALATAVGRTGSASREHRRLRSALVVAQIAMAVVLLIGAGLLLRSFWGLRAVDPGFAPANLLALRYHLPPSRYPQSFDSYPDGWGRVFGFQRDVLERLAAVPGVERTALAASGPLTAGFANSFVIIGREAEAARGQAEVPTRPVSANYFATAGIPLLQGRMFTDADDQRAPAVIIINEAMVRRYFPSGSPLGQRIRFWGVPREVIGVVGNERFAGLDVEPAPAVYPPVTQAPAAAGTLLVRTASDPRRLVPAVQRAIWSIDPDLAPFGITTMGDALDETMARERFLASLLAVFAGLALVLALVGVFGVVSYAVAQRERELGIRIALGAGGARILRAVVGEGLRLAMLGSVIGLAVAFATTRLARAQLFGVTATDPLSFGAAVVTMILVAVVGSVIPAVRATSTAPADVLRAA